MNPLMFGRQDVTDGTVNGTATALDHVDEPEHNVSFTELLIPMALSLMLSMIHSQIVATASSSHSCDKRKHVLQPKHRRKRERSTKRRKKPLRTRSMAVNDGQKETTIAEIRSYDNCDRDIDVVDGDATLADIGGHTDMVIVGKSILNAGRNRPASHNMPCDRSVDDGESSSSPKGLRRRNVNWDSPIKRQVIVQRRQSNDSIRPVTAGSNDLVDSANEQPNATGGDDDGFESLNGKSSSGEENSRLRLGTQFSRPKEPLLKTPNADSSDTDEEGDDGESLSSPGNTSHYTEGTTSATEWIGITTNSEECSYSSGDLDHHSDSQIECSENGTVEYDYFTPTVILNPACGIGDRSEFHVFVLNLHDG